MRALARQHAAVLGGSVAGCLAARTAADHFDHVTVVERDSMGDSGPRPGAPQSHHTHVLLPAGAAIMDRLFPGLLAELTEAGVPAIRNLTQVLLAPNGLPLSRQPVQVSIPGYSPSRPFLESRIRSRLLDLPNVTICDQSIVLGPEGNDARTRATGVRIRNRLSGGERLLEADLVIDALGRNPNTPRWLADWGYRPPPEQRVTADVKYASQLVRIPSGSIPEHMILLSGGTELPAGLVLLAHEDNTHMFTVVGYPGYHPEGERDRMLDFAAMLAPDRIVDALRASEPLSEVRVHRYASNQRRRYEKLRRFPAGWLVTGDALSSFNPVYGQGMTLAAMEAEVLDECLARGDHNLARRFFRKVVKPIAGAWRMATAGDLSLPQVPERCPWSVRLAKAYADEVLALAEQDPEIAYRFFRVTGFVDPPTELIRPDISLPVIARLLRPQTSAVEKGADS